MTRYIGLDVHAKSTTAVVVDPKGKLKNQQVLETNGRALIEFIKLIPGQKSVCLEEGTQSQWLFEILSPHVDEVVVIHQVQKKCGNKSDQKDAKDLANKLRTGDFGVRVFKAKSRFRKLGLLVATYNKMQQDKVRVANRIKALFRACGLQTTGSDFLHPKRWSDLKRQLPANAQTSATLLRTQLDVLSDLLKEADLKIVQEAKRHKMFRILKTCPGIGDLRAAELLPIVMTPHRFRGRSQYWSYCGFGVVTMTSAEWEKDKDGRWQRVKKPSTRGLNRNYHRRLKDIYKGAATCIVGQKNGPLYAYYARQLQGDTDPSIAKVALARKLASITLTMWKNQEVFNEAKL